MVVSYPLDNEYARLTQPLQSSPGLASVWVARFHIFVLFTWWAVERGVAAHRGS